MRIPYRSDELDFIFERKRDTYWARYLYPFVAGVALYHCRRFPPFRYWLRYQRRYGALAGVTVVYNAAGYSLRNDLRTNNLYHDRLKPGKWGRDVKFRNRYLKNLNYGRTLQIWPSKSNFENLTFKIQFRKSDLQHPILKIWPSKSNFENMTFKIQFRKSDLQHPILIIWHSKSNFKKIRPSKSNFKNLTFKIKFKKSDLQNQNLKIWRSKSNFKNLKFWIVSGLLRFELEFESSMGRRPTVSEINDMYVNYFPDDMEHRREIEADRKNILENYVTLSYRPNDVRNYILLEHMVDYTTVLDPGRV